MSVLDVLFYSILASLIVPYTLGLLVLLWNGKEYKTEPKGNFAPTITLVIPTYNEGAVIERKLDNVLELDYPRDKLRIIVVDSGSTDDTRSIVRKFASEHDGRLSISILEQPSRMGKSEAINEALRHSDSEILALTDADVTFPAGSLYELVAGFQDPKVGAVSGVEVPVGGDAMAHRLEADYRRIYTAIRMAEASTDSPFMCESELSAYRRNILQPLPSGTMCDDIELTVGVRSKGYRSDYDLQAPFFEAEAGTLKSKFKHKLRRGMANQHALLRNSHLLFNKAYGRYGTVVYPFEFFTQIVSPVLLLAAVCVVIPLTITDPAAGLIAILVGGFSSLPSLAIVHRLMHKYSTMDAATPRGTGFWPLAAVAYISFQVALVASLLRLAFRGPVVNWTQISETRTAVAVTTRNEIV